MLNVRKVALGLLAGAVLLGSAAQTAEARAGRGFITNRSAAQKVSRMQGVLKARTVGRTNRYVKVASHRYGKDVRVRWVDKRTAAVAATSRNLTPSARQLVALAQGRAGDYGFKVQAGDVTGRGLPLMTDGGKVRVGVRRARNLRGLVSFVSGAVHDLARHVTGQKPNGKILAGSRSLSALPSNRLVNVSTGRAGRVSLDPADGR